MRARSNVPFNSRSACRSACSSGRYCATRLTRSSSEVSGGHHGVPARSNQLFQTLALLVERCFFHVIEYFRNGLDARQSIWPALIFTRHSEFHDAAEHDVEPPAGQLLDLGNHSGAADLVDVRSSGIVSFVSGLQRRHADDAVAFQRIRDHRAIAGLEDVQRPIDTWEEQRSLERKNGYLSRKRHDLRRIVGRRGLRPRSPGGCQQTANRQRARETLFHAAMMQHSGSGAENPSRRTCREYNSGP